MKKLIKRTPIFVMILSAAIYFSCMIAVISGTVALDCSGFAVDSHGNLYVGTGSCISVYRNGEKIQEIRNGTSRGYAFTITENDTLLLSTSTVVIEMNLNGEEINRYPDTEHIFYELQHKNIFSGKDGSSYHMRNFFGWVKILKDGEPFYQTPAKDLIVKVAMPISFFLAGGSGAVLFGMSAQDRKTKGYSIFQ